MSTSAQPPLWSGGDEKTRRPRVSVGQSYRTPAKHAALNKFVGHEVYATRNIPRIARACWFDLTAGDGIVATGEEWCLHCSPGIYAHHARHSRVPLDVWFFEHKRATFDRLQRSLAAQLPELGYQLCDDCWVCGNARLHTIFGSGHDASLATVDKTTAVLAIDDPNAITDWAMRPSFAAEARARTTFFRAVSTMGCNARGLKRLEQLIRDGWYEHIVMQKARLPLRHDLLLAKIDGDAAQWAYLFCEPLVWRDRTQAGVEGAFEAQGLLLTCAWLRRSPSAFRNLQDELFKTREERGVL